MADVKISALPTRTVVGTDILPGVNGTTTYQFIANDIAETLMDGVAQVAAIADPSAPSAGNGKIYFKNVAGRILPKWKGPSGLDTPMQASLAVNTVTMWLPGTGTTAAIAFGVSWTTAATQAHPGIANTNFMTQMRRATYTTTTTAGNASGVRSSANLCWRGNAAGQGGFFFVARFGILTYTSTMQIWCGLSAVTGLLAGDPSAQNDTICMSKDTGETTWQVLTRDTTAASKTSTGRTTAAAGTAEIFDFYAFAAPNGSNITVRVVDITTGTVLLDNTVKSSNLPTATAMLTAHAECRNQAGGAGSAVAMFLNKIYIETDT